MLIHSRLDTGPQYLCLSNTEFCLDEPTFFIVGPVEKRFTNFGCWTRVILRQNQVYFAISQPFAEGFANLVRPVI
jgi:hypothetical protein